MTFVAALAFVGCVRSPERDGALSASAGTSQATSAEGSMQAGAANLYDACSAADWGRARRIARLLRADWSALSPVVGREGADRPILDTIDDALPSAADAVERHARRACAGDASAVLLATAELEGSDAAQLSAWFRRLELDAEYRDFDAAVRDAARAEALWPRARAAVAASRTHEVDAALAACRGAAGEHDAVALRHASVEAMSLVGSGY